MDYVNVSRLPVISSYHQDLTDEDLKVLALQLRRDVIEMTKYSGTHSSHLGGELSVADIMAVMYGKILKLDPADPLWEARDRFILSKGHVSVTQYAAMAWRGFFPREVLYNEFNRLGGRLQEHANMELPGIEAPTGSLGMGLANGCGMAWASRLKYDGMVPPCHVYAVLGDGECTEGQTWEAAMFAGHNRLENLIAVIDCNKYVISASMQSVMDLEPYEDKWRDFGWHVQRVDGHNVTALREALETAGKHETAPGKPRMIIADTNKGYPLSFMMKDPISWHNGRMTEELYEKCMKELKYE